MKFSNYARRTMVNAIMADIPQVDYVQVSRDRIRAAATKAIPAPLRPLIEKYPQWFTKNSFSYDLFKPEVGVRSFGHYIEHLGPKLPVATGYLTDEERAKRDKQSRDREAAKDALLNKLHSFSTVAQARKAMPEFEKYFPAAPAGPAYSGRASVEQKWNSFGTSV